MFVGHYAAGLAIKSFAPKVPAVPIVLGVGVLDIVDGILAIVGVNHVEPNPEAGPYLFFDLIFIDWDHSLLMAVVLSLLWGLIFLRKGWAVAAVAAGAAFSHWILDLPVHNADLALFPYSDTELGFGLWGRMLTGAWVLEGIVSAIFLVIAWIKFTSRGVRPADLIWPTVIVAVLFLALSPWFSPMWHASALGEPAAHILYGVLVVLGFLIPGLVLSRLIDRAERRAIRRGSHR